MEGTSIIDPRRPESKQAVKNIIQVYKQADRYDHECGWTYWERLNSALSERYSQNFTIKQVSGAFAALSPNNDETGNFKSLNNLVTAFLNGQQFEDFTVRTYHANKLKAWRIVRYGEQPEQVIKGLKTWNFFMNIWAAESSSYVTIDGHMVSVWLGRRVLLKSREASLTTGEYKQIANDYKRAARHVHLRPNILQAIVWLTWRRANNILYKPQMNLFPDPYGLPQLPQ